MLELFSSVELPTQCPEVKSLVNQLQPVPEIAYLASGS